MMCTKDAYSQRESALAAKRIMEAKEPKQRYRIYNDCPDHPGMYHITHKRKINQNGNRT